MIITLQDGRVFEHYGVVHTYYDAQYLVVKEEGRVSKYLIGYIDEVEL